MDFIIYYITFKNFEENEVEIQLQDLSTLENPPGDTVNVNLEGSDEPGLAPVLMDSIGDEDKTQAIRGKRMRLGFNSDEDYDVETFSNGSDTRFLVRLLTGGVALPFLGSMVIDDNSEAFQPKPNPVQLAAGSGLGLIKSKELTDNGELPLGHYSIIDYLVMCLGDLIPGQQMHIVFNLFEVDTDPDTSHAFIDTFLDALTFEKDVDSRESRDTVLNKILDWAGCFITYDHDGWWIIRWEEYDGEDPVVTLRVATFDASDGSFQGYSTVDVDKTIAADYSAEYEGYRLSMDTAQKRFQRKAKSVRHFYNFEQPKEVPCNGKFTRGTPIDTVLPLLTYEVECWTMKKGRPGAYDTVGSDAYIGVRFDDNGYETERFVEITPEPVHNNASDHQTYLESSPIPIMEGDKFDIRIDWRLTANAAAGNNYNLMRIMLHGDDNSYWLLGNETIPDSSTPLKWWNTSGWTVNMAAGGTDVDFTVIEETEWQNLSYEAPAVPVSGNLYIWLNQINQTNISGDDRFINYSEIDFKYRPLINGTYKTSLGQEVKVSDDSDCVEMEKQMFISDSPRPLFKGAMKKFNGTSYVLTETWNYYNDTDIIPNDRMSKHIVFQWWNQFRKRRTIIESDLQGLNSDQEFGIPGLIHRWKIKHENQGDKYFMLTSFKNMNFRTCGWNGVFVEMSSGDGDRSYDDEFNFRYIK